MADQFEFYDNIYSKNGMAVVMIARGMLEMAPGDRIKTVAEYASNYHVGRGTVQYALKFLSDADAVHFEARGHKGTYILDMDFQKLLQLSGINNIACCMPLPYSARYEGLATGLYTVFQEKGIPFNIAYIRGAMNRINQLKEKKFDFAIVSKKTAEYAVAEDAKLNILHDFGDYSFVGQRVYIFRDPKAMKIEAGMRVAIDYSSVDQFKMTEEMCQGIDVTYVETSYAQIMKLFQKNRIDAAIWNGDELGIGGYELNVVPIESTGTDDKKAAILGLSENAAVNNIIKNSIDGTLIETIQAGVMKGDIVPNY